MIAPTLLKVPKQSMALGTKKVSDLVSSGTYVEPDGTVVGTLKYVKDFSDLYPGEETGHFFPTTFGEEYDKAKIKIKGLKNGDREATLDDDRTLIIRVENLNGKTAEIEKDGETLVTFDFTSTVLQPQK